MKELMWYAIGGATGAIVAAIWFAAQMQDITQGGQQFLCILVK